MSEVVTSPIDMIAKVIGLTPRRVRQLVDEGLIPRDEPGRHALIACVQGYIKLLAKGLRLGKWE